MTSPKMDAKRYCPTMRGTMTAYKPEYRFDTFDSSDGPTFTKWIEVPYEVRAAHPCGVHYPRFAGGVVQTIGLLGHAQAHAIAWSFAAEQESLGKTIEVRVVKFDLEYDIKAKESDDQTGR